MSSQAIRAGAAFVEIFADDSKMMRTLAKSQIALRKWGKAASAAGTKLIAAGTAMLAPLLAATRAYASMGAEMARGAQKTGMAVESLSQLKYAANQSGVEFEKLETGIARMNRSILNAAQGSQQSQEAFAHLGLSVAQLSRMKPEEQFRAIAEALSKIKNPTLRSGLVQQIFGRSGTELLPLLNQGAAGIDKMMKRADELGLTMSTSAANGALAFDQKLNDLWQVVKMGVFQIGGALAPVLDTVTGYMIKGIGVVRDFISQHQGLIIAAAGAGAALLAGGIILKGVGAVLSIASGAVGIFSTGLAIAGAVMGAALSPLGLMTVGLLGGAAAFLYLTKAGAATREYLSGVFSDLRDETVTAFQGIRNAMAAGDWGLAAKILWTYVKLESLKGKTFLRSTWISIKAETLDIWSSTVEGIEKLWSYAKEYLSNWDGVRTAITKVTNWFKSTWENVIDYVADKFANLMIERDFAKREKEIRAQGKRAGLSDTQIQKQVDDERKFQLQQRDSNRADRDRQKEADYNAKQRAADDAYKAAHPELVQQEEAARKRIEDEQKARRGANDDEAAKARQDAIDQASQELSDLKKQLASGAQQAQAEAGKSRTFNAPTFDQNAAADGLDGMMKSTVAGTFSAAGAFGLGSGNTTERIAKATEKTAQFVEMILKEGKGGAKSAAGLSFGS